LGEKNNEPGIYDGPVLEVLNEVKIHGVGGNELRLNRNAIFGCHNVALGRKVLLSMLKIIMKQRERPQDGRKDLAPELKKRCAVRKKNVNLS
jgi:hypothetical protein